MSSSKNETNNDLSAYLYIRQCLRTVSALQDRTGTRDIYHSSIMDITALFEHIFEINYSNLMELNEQELKDYILKKFITPSYIALQLDDGIKRLGDINRHHSGLLQNLELNPQDRMKQELNLDVQRQSFYREKYGTIILEDDLGILNIFFELYINFVQSEYGELSEQLEKIFQGNEPNMAKALHILDILEEAYDSLETMRFKGSDILRKK